MSCAGNVVFLPSNAAPLAVNFLLIFFSSSEQRAALAARVRPASRTSSKTNSAELAAPARKSNPATPLNVRMHFQISCEQRTNLDVPTVSCEAPCVANVTVCNANCVALGKLPTNALLSLAIEQLL